MPSEIMKTSGINELWSVDKKIITCTQPHIFIHLKYDTRVPLDSIWKVMCTSKDRIESNIHIYKVSFMDNYIMHFKRVGGLN